MRVCVYTGLELRSSAVQRLSALLACVLKLEASSSMQQETPTTVLPFHRIQEGRDNLRMRKSLSQCVSTDDGSMTYGDCTQHCHGSNTYMHTNVCVKTGNVASMPKGKSTVNTGRLKPKDEQLPSC